MLEDLFAILTQGNGSPWQPSPGISLPVFLVSQTPAQISSGQSCICNWDYALTVRNTFPSFILLVDVAEWDERTYSMVNATSAIGRPLSAIKRSVPPLKEWNTLYAELVQIVAQEVGLEYGDLEAALRECLRDLPALQPLQQQLLPWEIIDRLARLPTSGIPVDFNEVAAECGLLASSEAGTYGRGRTVLEQLGRLLDDNGIEGGIDELKATSRGAQLAVHLDGLGDHIRREATSAAAFRRAPSFFLRCPLPRPEWWQVLTVAELERMLAEIGRGPATERISVTCTNALNRQQVPGEPYLVKDFPQIYVEHPSGQFQTLRLARRIGRRRSELLATPGFVASPWIFTEGAAPEHDSGLTYVAEDAGASPASVSVVSLAQFAPRAFVTCQGPGTVKVGMPRRSRPGARWEQQIELRTTGTKTFRAYCSPGVAAVRVPGLQLPQVVYEGVADIQLEIDDDDEIGIDFVDESGNLLSTTTLDIMVRHEDQETALSVFDALVRAHQEGKTEPLAATATDSWLRRMEDEVLANEESWRPALAGPGWSDSSPRQLSSNARLLGSVVPQVDPRPSADHFSAPGDFLEARERVRRWLRRQALQLPEIDLSAEDVTGLTADYLEEYRKWIEAAPEEACWADVIAILEKEPIQYGQRQYAAREPIAVLLSPLHPLRLAWQVAAQNTLSAALEAPCPLAGLLDPHRCPDALALPIARSGGAPTWRPYLSISCQDALWGLFWDANRIRDFHNHESLGELSRVGAVPRGVQTGFTASQSRKTLEEITRVLPTRSIMRLGIVSSGSGNSSCSDGLMDWCRDRFKDDDEIVSGPRSIEVFDDRTVAYQPPNEEIASLADDTGHRVRWFSFGPAVTKDLVIVDQLGVAGPSPEVHEWKSPTSEGSLVRNRLRMDLNSAEWVVESRTGLTVRSEDRLLDQVGIVTALVEDLATSRARSSHLGFTPNPEVMDTELQNAKFLAVSSAEIDPACFVRGTLRGGGYLWDYQLPQAQGPGEQRGGFYLLAQPPDAIKTAVRSALGLVTQADIDLDALLLETSRRGIPILKRLSAGGTQAKGELGMLLAVRLLQDAFRDQGGRVRLPVVDGNTIHMVLPVDPWTAPIDTVRRNLIEGSEATRPDLIVVCIRMEPGQGVLIRLVPLEVKFREGVMSNRDKTDSLRQAKSLGTLLYQVLQDSPRNDLWRLCGRGFLAEMLDYGFRVYGDRSLTGKEPEEWVIMHQECLAHVLDGTAVVTVASEGRLLVVDESPLTQAVDLDGDGLEETFILNRQDAGALLEEGSVLSETAERLVVLLELCGPIEDSDATTVESASTQESTVSAPPTSGSVTGEPGQRHSGHADGPSRPAVSSEVRQRVTEGLAGFVGNHAAVETLRRALLRALLTSPPQLPASYLFTGNPSTGKTELARRVARCLGLPFVSLDGRGLGNRERLFDLIDGALRDSGQAPVQVGTRYQRPVFRYPPFVVFIDEVHLVPRAIQESFLTALEPMDRSVLLADRVALLPEATFLFATTRPSDVDAAFRTRCMEIPLQDYTEEEVAAIVGMSHPDLPDHLRRKIARYGRLVPRIALEVSRELANESLVSEHQERSLDDHLEEVRRTRLIDTNGLGLADIEYLELLDGESRPLGERSILAMLTNIDKDRVLEEVEPLVVARLRLARKTDRGREITPEGRRYLLELRRQRRG